MTQTITSENPLIDLPFRVPFDLIRPEHAEPAVDALIQRSRENLHDVVRHADHASFLARLDQLTRDLEAAAGVVSHHDSVVSNEQWRAAYNAIVPKLSAFRTELQLDPELWAAVKRFAETPHAQALTGEKTRYLKLTMDGFRRNGADLPDDKKARLRDINTRLAKLSTSFAQNVLDATAKYELLVDEERLAGVPDRVKNALREDARKHGKDGYRLTLQIAARQNPILMYAHDRALRQELWEAYNRVGMEDPHDNRPLIRELLTLRREKANLLGFENYADFVLADRMAGSGERAQAFERDLEAKTRPFFERENAELEAFYREHAGQDAPDLMPWDVQYWEERQRATKYAFDTEALRPYFPLNQVVQGAFEIARRAFGVEVREAQAPGWHEDVRFYEVFDQGEHVGSFYTDWHPRPSKRGGAWANSFHKGGPAQDGFRPHLGLMIGNLTPPSGDQPALLDHRDVETVFHEFGHVLHQLLSRVETRALSGTSVPWDFVELPSQIMENWTWEREALDLFARHYQTGERIPDELFAKLQAAKNYRAANTQMRQLMFGSVDLALHIDWDGEEDPLVFGRRLSERFVPTPLPQAYGQLASFSHIFAGGYAAGYYSYKWAEVLDADAFSRFASEGIFNQRTGREFVERVLARGNSEDPSVLYRSFMGRDPDANALLARLGLISAS